jgi:hypothetical protein
VKLLTVSITCAIPLISTQFPQLSRIVRSSPNQMGERA